MIAKKKLNIPVPMPVKPVFSKSKILTLNRYAGRRDLLSMLLKDGEAYTMDQVDSMIQKFMKGRK